MRDDAKGCSEYMMKKIFGYKLYGTRHLLGFFIRFVPIIASMGLFNQKINLVNSSTEGKNFLPVSPFNSNIKKTYSYIRKKNV